MPISTYLRSALVMHTTGTTPWVAPTHFSIGLYSALPSINGGGDELTADNAPDYTRRTIAWSPTGASDLAINQAPVTFPGVVASGDWVTVVGIGLFDADVSGNLLAFEPLATPMRLLAGNQIRFLLGDITFTLV